MSWESKRDFRESGTSSTENLRDVKPVSGKQSVRVPLGEVAEFINGVAFKPADWSDEGQRIVRIQNLTDSSKPFNCTTRVVDDKYHVRAGDMLVSWSATLGVFVWDGPDVALVNQHIFRVLPRPDRVYGGYLRHMLIDALAEMERHLHGATMKHVNRNEFLATTIPLPPLAEQKRIAAILDAADALRAKRRQTLAELDTLLQSTFLDMFGDPVTNPKGWEVVSFGDVGKSRLGKMLDRGKPKGHTVYPYLANFNVQWELIQLSELRSMEFSESDRQEFSLEYGDILVCEGGEVGRSAIWRGEREGIYFQKALHRVRLDPNRAVPEYIQKYMWFMAKNGGFKDYASTATIAHLTGVKMKKLPVPLPPLTLQHQFAAIVESVERQKTHLRAHLAELDTLFASLQSRAFKGEL